MFAHCLSTVNKLLSIVDERKYVFTAFQLTIVNKRNTVLTAC